MEEIFISFSSKNSDKANEICAFLEQAGRPCFIASRDLTAGMEYAAQLVERLDEEKAALVQTANRTKGNVFSADAEEGYVETKDLVWLLSNDELTYLSDAGIPIYARITDSAVEKDTENYVKTFFETYAVDNYYWWLRDSAEKVNEGYIVTTDCEDEDTVMTASVGATVYGIRPAICVSPKLLPDEGEESDR